LPGSRDERRLEQPPIFILTAQKPSRLGGRLQSAAFRLHSTLFYGQESLDQPQCTQTWDGEKVCRAACRAKAKKDYAGLAQLPRDASPTRVVNRCEVSGRRRAFIRRFKMSRLTFRELASQGLIPGVTKSSW